MIAGIFVGICFCTHSAFADSGLPTLNLTLKDTTYEIVAAGEKDDKYPGNSLSIIADGKVSNYSNVELKGRGNSTWDAPKKPFQIKFEDKTNLFDMGASKKWVLLADYYDDSHLRNHLAFYFANLLEMDYANHSLHVDLYIDGQYMGVYLLCHKAELGKSTVNLKDELGTLIEMDNIHEPDEEYFTSDYGQHLMLQKDAVSDDDEELTAAALEDFKQAFNRFEKALYANDYDSAKAEIDVESFAKYFLMFEYSADVDGIASSVYFYKDGSEDVIHAGPAWDYDFAFSNEKWQHGQIISPYYSWAQTIVRYDDPNSQWDSEIFARLMDHPEFRNLVKRIFQEKVAPNFEAIDSFIISATNKIRISAYRDQQLWQRDDFYESTNYVREWSRKRLEYLNILYGTSTEITSGSYRIRSYSLQLNDQLFTNDFYFQPQDDGSYKIIDVNTGRALTANHPHSTDSTVTFARPLNNDSQRWYIPHTRQSQNYIISKTSGLFLTAKGDKLILQEYRYNDTQTFNLFYRMKSIVKTNGTSYYQLTPNYNSNLVYSGKELVAANDLTAKSYLVTKNYDSSYNLIDPETGENKNWIIQEANNGSLKLIHPQRLQILSHQGTAVSLEEESDADNQGWQLVEKRLPQLSNPLIIVKP